MKSVHLRPTAHVGRRDHGAAEANPRPGGLPHALDAKLLASPLSAGRKSVEAALVKCGGAASALVPDRNNAAPVDARLELWIKLCPLGVRRLYPGGNPRRGRGLQARSFDPCP
jgi:hypothetical protein